jgi:hypothetical protein
MLTDPQFSNACLAWQRAYLEEPSRDLVTSDAIWEAQHTIL